MSTQKTILVLVVLIGMAGAAFLYFSQKAALQENSTATPDSPARVMSIQSYVTQHISELSQTKAEFGGTLYVTHVDAKNGIGIVEYEDGHNAYVADFEYTLDPERGITISSFITR